MNIVHCGIPNCLSAAVQTAKDSFPGSLSWLRRPRAQISNIGFGMRVEKLPGQIGILFAMYGLDPGWVPLKRTLSLC